MSLHAVSNDTLSNFNAEVQNLIKLLAGEFPAVTEVKLLKVKVTMAISAKARLLYDLFCAHVKPEHTMKIMMDDASFVDDAKKECKADQDASAFLPVVAMLWEKGGKETSDPKILQRKIMFHLKKICLATLPPSSSSSAAETAGGKNKGKAVHKNPKPYSKPSKVSPAVSR